MMGATFVVDAEVIKAEVEQGLVRELPMPVHGSVLSVTQARDVRRAQISNRVRSGYVFDTEVTSKQIASAFEEGTLELEVSATSEQGTLLFADGGTNQTLTLLATGKSNYAKSPAARIVNVKKSINEHIQGVIVPAGETFSFNATLDGPVTLNKGWVEALGLFGGGAAMTPGGGICQAATTVYRAAALAGFPMLRRKSHSLYVSYYESYGVGVDATIFPGIQDLVFLNDTDSPLVFQSYIDGEDVYVEVYGKDDGRKVDMKGPFFAGNRNRPSSLPVLNYNEIGWVQEVRYADGSVREQPLISRYVKGFSRNVATKYGNEYGREQLYAAAPEEMVQN
jgi:vancomycin resistance protein YoaR